jgi:hypothetical protein
MRYSSIEQGSLRLRVYTHWMMLAALFVQ